MAGRPEVTLLVRSLFGRGLFGRGLFGRGLFGRGLFGRGLFMGPFERSLFGQVPVDGSRRNRSPSLARISVPASGRFRPARCLAEWAPRLAMSAISRHCATFGVAWHVRHSPVASLRASPAACRSVRGLGRGRVQSWLCHRRRYSDKGRASARPRRSTGPSRLNLLAVQEQLANLRGSWFVQVPCTYCGM